MERRSISCFLYMILLWFINQVYGNNDCTKITMTDIGADKCLETCKTGNNSNECIQWRCNNFKEMLQSFNFSDSQLENYKNSIINSPNCNIPNNNQNNIFVYDTTGDVVEMNLGGKLNSGIINEYICALTNLKTINISNNNLKGNNTVYGQLPGCLNALSSLINLDISNNKFRGRIPFIGPQIQTCNILSNNLCLFHGDKIPKVCLDNPSSAEDMKLNDAEYKKGDNVYFSLCENIFVGKDQNTTSKIFNDVKNTNITPRILFFSGIFPICSLIITTAITIYGRIKSKFNKRDPDITTFSASISRLPNNFGNISNSNRHSNLTKYDSYNRPAPRSDENLSIFSNNYEQKRISSNPSNPSTSFANTSLSSNTPSSPVISPNEIKNSNYRVIGSHYSLSMNPNQAIRFKNTLSMMQNNRSSLTMNTSTEVSSTPPTTTTTATAEVQPTMNDNFDTANVNTTSTPVVDENEPQNQNPILSPTLNSVSSKNNGNSTTSKAKESLDLLLSSPQAMYYKNNINEHRKEALSPKFNKQNNPQKVMSPIQPPKVYPPIKEKPSPNMFAKSPIMNKSPVLMNNIGYSAKVPTSPTMSVPQFISSQPSFKMNQSLSNRRSPTSGKKPRIRKVVYSFIADLPDELPLIPGDEVIIHKAFDDGYAYGENVSTGKFGVFPITSFHPKDQDISPEEMESSPSINDIQTSQISNENMKSPTMMSPVFNKTNLRSEYNNINNINNNQNITPTLIVNNKDIQGNTSSEPYSNVVNMNNLYPMNNSQNSNSQNSNSQNSLTDEDDIDSLRRQSKIGYSAFMDQQKQKLMKKQAKELARRNKLNALNRNSYYGNEGKTYKEPLSPTYIPQNMILNENINNRMFGESQNSQYSIHTQHSLPSQPSQPSQLSQHSINDIANSSFNSSINSSFITNYKSILNKGIQSESPSSIEMQKIEDRRHKQIKLLNERLSKKDIGPEEKRYYLQLLQQLSN